MPDDDATPSLVLKDHDSFVPDSCVSASFLLFFAIQSLNRQYRQHD